MTDAGLRALLLDCLLLWEIEGRVLVGDAGLTIETADGAFTLERADHSMRPVRFVYQTPERRAAGRPPRVAPSIVAALSGLRNVMGGAKGDRVRIGR